MARGLTFRFSTAGLIAVTAFLSGCMVGPKYHTPTAQTPAAYKEVTPENMNQVDNWKLAQPGDTMIRGKWWEMFGDPELNKLEDQVDASNQTIAASYASFMAARALALQARAQFFPTGTTSPSINKTHQASNLTGTSSANASSFTVYDLPFDATWVPDLWGRVRNTVRSNVYNAQASAADFQNVRLTIHAELAADYFELRSQDALKQLLDSTVKAYQESLRLTQVLYETGIDSQEAVAQAETQLDTTLAEDTNLGIARAQLEHAIAVLTGQPPSTFSIQPQPLKFAPPPIPLSLPSQLLERRPDIAASERLVAQANAQIGIAKAAYYPTVTLSAAGGLESSQFTDWFTWPSHFWSIGAAAAETIFDAGLRRAAVQQFEQQYNQTVANYRQTVLTAFQQVEDNLASVRILSLQIDQQDAAVKAAQRNLDIATDRYKLGIDPYLNVITAQTTLLINQQTAVNLRSQQMVSSVQLVEALGGGWGRSQLPSPAGILSRNASPGPGSPAQAGVKTAGSDSPASTQPPQK
ncbi:MAG TPA: efflux transporter outer membrane subunit [Candidatus Acidoferrum sp.]|nr:efflux transporter outer membrane subunit [Candidatus Acidoferrum sp.]